MVNSNMIEIGDLVQDKNARKENYNYCIVKKIEIDGAYKKIWGNWSKGKLDLVNAIKEFNEDDNQLFGFSNKLNIMRKAAYVNIRVDR